MTDIIPQVPEKQQQPRWQEALKTLITDPLSLLNYLEITPNDVPWQFDKAFPMRVPLSFAQRMKKGDPNDPLLRQVLSVSSENQKDPKFSPDPLQEQDKRYNPVPGLLHKYDSRVLLTFSPSCAVNCRYCFRRHFPYENNNPGRKHWNEALNYIASQPNIIEVILSGGEPLMASDENIAFFLESLSKISHVKLLRFHTRFPIVIPERINTEFAKMLSSFRFTTTLVYHTNHPNEIIPAIAEGVMILRAHNITVLNQCVLLKNVNDSVECLKNLSLALYTAGIVPYYVHLLDPVEGTAHFDIPVSDAKALQNSLRSELPGYLVPTFVREIPGERSKIPL